MKDTMNAAAPTIAIPAEDEANNAPKRGRPKKERPRRDYAKELHALEGRVQTAVRLLKRGGEGTLLPQMVAVAIETLEG